MRSTTSSKPSLVGFIIVFLMTYSVRAQDTMDPRGTRCLSAVQSDCCTVNVKLLERATRNYVSSSTTSGTSSKNSMTYLVESLDNIQSIIKDINLGSSSGPEKCNESIAKSTNELLVNFLTHETSGKKASFKTLMTKIAIIESSSYNISLGQEKSISQMNKSIHRSTGVILGVLQELIDKQTSNITLGLSLESGKNSRQIQNNMGVLINTSNEKLTGQERKIDNIGRRLDQLISTRGNQSQSDTNSCSRIELFLGDKAQRIESRISETHQQLTQNIQTKAETFQRMLQGIVARIESMSNVTNTQSVILQKLEEGQQKEDRQARDLVDKLEQNKNSATRLTVQKASELAQQLHRFQQLQNSTSHQQFETLATSLQQLRQLQQAEQQRQQLQQLERYDNLTKQLIELQRAQRTEQSEQLLMKQLLQQGRTEHQEMKLSLEQLKREQQQQKELANQLLANQNTMNQLLQEVKRQFQPAENKTIRSNTSTTNDCVSLKREGRHSGVYPAISKTSQTQQVYCDMDTAGGGWTVIQRRKDGSVNFYLKWADYKRGFGNLTGEFWLGNDYLSELTRGGVRLRVDMTKAGSGARGWAEYSSFSVDSEANNYRLSVGGYTGNAGDSLSLLSGANFSTIDGDNDGSKYFNRAASHRGAWWYSHTSSPSNLNGMYIGAPGAQRNFWASFHQTNGLKFVEMKIRRN